MPDYSFNPFIEIIETTKHPTARIRRTSFWQKCHDSFYVISGRLGGEENTHVGLFDYGTLFILILIDNWVDFSGQKFAEAEGVMSKCLYGLLNVAFILPFLIPRIIVAALCTLAAAPVIALIHAGIFLYTRKDMEVALSISISGKESLQQYLEQHPRVNIDQLSIGVKYDESQLEGQQKGYQLAFWIDHNRLGILKARTDNAEQITQLCAFNIGGIAEDLERKGELESFESFLAGIRSSNIRP